VLFFLNSVLATVCDDICSQPEWKQAKDGM
jgi:hypothetical protein